MAGLIQRVKPGDTMRIRASDWNKIADAVDQFAASRTQGNRAATESLNPGEAWGKNASLSDVGRFSILGIDDAMVQPHHAFGSFSENVKLKLIAPTTAHVGGKFAVCITPIRVGGVGRVLLRGETPALVEMLDESHQFATCEDGTTGNLISAETGPAQLLFVQESSEREDPTLAWCYVSLMATIMEGA